MKKINTKYGDENMDLTNIKDVLASLIILIPAVLITLTIHEFGHAYAAYKLGDTTAKEEGRLSLNPLRHIDPIGLLSLVIFRFGWGKPVPVDFTALRNLKKGMIIVSLAGPFANLLIAGVFSLIYRFMISRPFALSYLGYFISLIQYTIMLSIYLAIFNLIPIPPLDGSKIVFALTKNPLRFIYDDALNYYGIIFLVILLAIPIFKFDQLLMQIAGPILKFLIP
ncbi:MAG: site-2 protease family protein [Caldisericaceae bacterium]